MELLLHLLVLLIAARALGGLAELFGQAPVMGELLAGAMLGVLIVVLPSDNFLATILGDHGVQVVADLGLFFLMLHAGIEADQQELLDNSRTAVFAAFGGAFVPLILGFWLGWELLPDDGMRTARALFIGVALSITAVPVTMKVLLDLNLLHARIGETVVSAAVIDDVIGLVLLAVLTAVMSTGAAPTAGALLIIAGKVALFFAITIGIGHFAIPFVERRIPRMRIAEVAFARLLVFALAFGVIAELLGIHYLLGAFMAGLQFGRRDVGLARYESVESNVKAFTMAFLAPVFFASLGLNLDFTAISGAPLFLLALIAIAFFSKLVGAGLPCLLSGYSRREATAVGIAMSGRGVVELIVADIAFEAGLFDFHNNDPIVSSLFSAIVLTAFVTTAMTPFLLKQACEPVHAHLHAQPTRKKVRPPIR